MFGHEAMLGGSCGTDLYQTVLDRVWVVTGADRLGWARLTPKGPLSWVATCCKGPVVNTATARTVPFVSMMLAGVGDPAALGPVRAHV